MMLQSLAEANRLRTKRDACSDLYIPGRVGQSQIYEYGSGRLAVTVIPNKPRIWPNAKRKLPAAGFQITQDGDDEGTALFDPTNQSHLGLALKLIKAERARRQGGKGRPLTPARAQELARQRRTGWGIALGRIAEAGDDVGAIPACFQGKKACGDGSSSRAQLGGVSR